MPNVYHKTRRLYVTPLGIADLSAKLLLFFEILSKFKIKYIIITALVGIVALFVPSLCTPQAALYAASLRSGSNFLQDSIPPMQQIQPLDSSRLDSIPVLGQDSSATTAPDTARRAPKAFLNEKIESTTKDSMVYDVKNKLVYLYNEGDVKFQNMTLTADFMRINMDNKEIYAYGKIDTVDGKKVATQPVFEEGSGSYTMDTITYNIDSQKAKIKGVATQQGEGWLVGGSVKKMPDNTSYVAGGVYTTCDHLEAPHFYMQMRRAKLIPGQKVVFDYTYLVIEDVPLYILGLPGGYFPLNSGPRSGLLMPTYGEEYSKGFFLRDLGYYFTLSDHMDLTLTGGIYSLGSWETRAASRYIKRYKYSGAFNMEYSSVKAGEKGEPDYVAQNNFRIQWNHSQDPKANPGSTFSASVNFATSGYSRYSATNLNDILQTQTNSSISYSKNWAGTPFSLSANMAVSQNSQNQTISVTLPNVVFNVSRIYPLKRKEVIGKERWYEKISASYTGKLTNSVTTTESEIFTSQTLQDMKNGVEHTIPVSASFNVLNYINISPSFNYTERWFLKSQEQQWNPASNSVETLDPDYSFNRLYNYNTALSASTTIYGMVQSTSKTSKVQAVRHTITPSVSVSYTPNFGDPKYGYYQTIQSDSMGGFTTYSPYSINAYGVPSQGESASLNFSLSQNLEMKVLSKRDTSGVRKISLIDQLSVSASYNFLADSMRLSTIPISLRTKILKNYSLNLNMTLDPYKVTPEGQRYDELFFPGRIISTGWSFSYTFKSRESGAQPAINDITSIPSLYTNPFYDPYGTMDPTLRRQYMSQAYYDFSIPWNLGVNYNINYRASYVNNGTTGYQPTVTQTIGFNGSVNLTSKTGLTFQGGYDIKTRELTTSSIAISRDLHCFQMSFNWIPFGFHRSWSFNIGAKAASLADLKYDKSQSMYDNLFQ